MTVSLVCMVCNKHSDTTFGLMDMVNNPEECISEYGWFVGDDKRFYCSTFCLPLKTTKDERGFKVYGEFMDTYGNTIIVKQSSTAFADRLWIFTENNPEYLKNPGSAHLDKIQVLTLIKLLEAAAKDMITDEEYEEELEE